MSNKTNHSFTRTLMVGATCMALVGLWAVLAVPGTALANQPDANGNHNHGDDGDDGGNVVKSDIPAMLTLDDLLGDGITSDGGVGGGTPSYEDGFEAVSCVVGRRRTIWTTLAGRSDRKMELLLGDPDYLPFAASRAMDGDIKVGDNPSGDPVATPPDPMDPEVWGGATTMHEVECVVALEHNVSGLGDIIDDSVRRYCPNEEPFDTMCANTRFTFYDGRGDQWRIAFGPGGRPIAADITDPLADKFWPGEQYFTSPAAPPVVVKRLPDGEGGIKKWEVFATGNPAPGFLWFKGSKKNAPWIYVGAFNFHWGCTADSLP